MEWNHCLIQFNINQYLFDRNILLTWILAIEFKESCIDKILKLWTKPVKYLIQIKNAYTQPVCDIIGFSEKRDLTDSFLTKKKITS